MCTIIWTHFGYYVNSQHCMRTKKTSTFVPAHGEQKPAKRIETTLSYSRVYFLGPVLSHDWSSAVTVVFLLSPSTPLVKHDFEYALQTAEYAGSTAEYAGSTAEYAGITAEYTGSTAEYAGSFRILLCCVLIISEGFKGDHTFLQISLFFLHIRF